jgi:maltose/maltodextrin transport system substrate-binding protein
MRKLVLFLFVAFAMVSTLNAAVTVWTSEVQVPVLQKIGADFEKNYGIEVRIEQVNFGDIKSKFLTAAPAGEGPDVIVGAHDWVGELVENGLIEPIPFLPEKDQFYESALNAFSYKGKLYGVPYAIEALAILYNKDLVDEVPETIEELETIGAEVADDEVVGFIYPATDFYFSYPFISGFGGYVFNLTDQGYDVADIGLANEGAIKGGKLIKSWFDTGLIPQGANYSLMDSLFRDGLAAFIVNGPWSTSGYQEAGIDYDILPFSEITLSSGENPIPFVGVQAFMVNSRSSNKLEAMEFVASYCSTFETQYELFLNDKRGPVREDVFAYIEGTGGQEVYDILQFSKSASIGNPMPNVPEMAPVWGAMQDSLGLVINGEDTVENAFETAVEKIKTSIGM